MKRTRKEMVEQRKTVGSYNLYSAAQSIETGTSVLKAERNSTVTTNREKALLLRAEELGLRAAQVARRIARRMEELK